MNINDFSVFRGNLICSNGALGVLNRGVTLDGRAFSITGALITTNITATMPCDLITGVPDGASEGGCTGISIFPNRSSPLSPSRWTQPLTTVGSSDLVPGIYSYQLIGADGSVRAGKLVAEQ